VIFGQRIRYFPLERIKREMDLLVDKYNIKILYFQDDTFTANERMVNDICDYITEKGYDKKLEINVSTRPDAVCLPTLRKMKNAGVKWICFGVESGNQRILDRMGKGISVQQIKDAFKKANDVGLYVNGNFMIGHLGETYESAMDTINLACSLGQDYASFSIAIPLPGTELYRHCVDNGIRLPSWSGFGNVNSPPIPLNDGLSSDLIRKLRILAVNRFFKRSAYLIRLSGRFHFLSLIKDFVRMHIALKKEIRAGRY
jgi:radical SAM superfamily enzyme YgiQ (UPF0313 family)